MTSHRVCRFGLTILALAGVLIAGCGSGASAPGSPDGMAGSGGGGSGGGGAGGVRRVTLSGNYVADTTQGFNLATGAITQGSADSDFHLTMTMVVSLFPTTTMNGFCEKVRAAGTAPYARVEEVPGDAAGCNWTTGYLGGNSEHTASQFDGMGFLVRDRNGVAVAKLLTISDAIVAADVTVTFDIIGL